VKLKLLRKLKPEKLFHKWSGQLYQIDPKN
jgi:hypothetical protein